MNTPLSVIVVRQGPPADSELFAAALRKAFLGCEKTESYAAADYELLNPVDFRVFSTATLGKAGSTRRLFPDDHKETIAQNSTHLLVVLIIAVPDTNEARQMILEWGRFAKTHPRSTVIIFAVGSARPIPIPENLPRHRMPSLGLDDLDERDLRRDFLALHSLHRALQMLSAAGREAKTTSTKAPKTTLFFSHAKRDGVPLSTSLVSWMSRLKGFKFFYDTISLDLGGDINTQLERAVEGSVVVVLRTEIFDQRYWCQKEVYWAEKHNVPVIAVDARWNVKIAPSVIALDSSPSVRIPDGSLVRILQAAFEEALRVALHRARARLIAAQATISPESWFPISRQPSMVSLESARNFSLRLSQPRRRTPFFVVYPNPPLPDGLRDSAASVCQRLIPKSKLVSLDEFRIHCLSLSR